jgi:hypothetical protein
MAIPSGSGTEVLKRAALNITAADGDAKIIDGVANHIYTVLSIFVFNDHATDNAEIEIYVNESATTPRKIVEGLPLIAANSTFVWNDKFVLTGTDELMVNTNKDNGYFYVSYIDQDWT